jgi:hypothetical protein
VVEIPGIHHGAVVAPAPDAVPVGEATRLHAVAPARSEQFRQTNLRMYQEFRKAVLGVYGTRRRGAGRKLAG